MNNKKYVSMIRRVSSWTLVLALVIIGIRFVLIPKYLYPKGYSEYVESLSEEYDLDPYLVYSVIRTESRFREDALSHKGAMGLMQVTESTAWWISAKSGIVLGPGEDYYTPKVNIRMGCWYLRWLLDYYKNQDTALAAYNAGSGTVSGWLKDPERSSDGMTLKDIPYKETREYVEKINDAYKAYQLLYS